MEQQVSQRATFHEAAVIARRLLTPGMVRLTFSGLDAFRSTGIGDEYIRLFFRDPDTGTLPLPAIDADGRWTFPEEGPPVRYSTYTVRRFDAAACEMDVDFVVHEGGIASSWAQAAEPGDTIVINNPRGLYQPPEGHRWQVLLADATGLPALARLIEQTPAHVASRVVVEVADAAHVQALPAHPRLSVSTVHGRGNGVCASCLEEAFALLPLPEGTGYVWMAGEQAAARRLRQSVKTMPALGSARSKVVAYWIAHDGEGEAPAPVAALGEHLRAELAADWAHLLADG
ncbi:siderophore-interacting protein [Azorhizobium oxalatiphilum]|uniref:Siderophore-interacting protein n=1 Tax=Azorhizobium oxalatiphilum TaxID=980631 RepID=A0A917F8V9_9HYPH|nr:siderophore-interacting protein [Azorhizobium oxalatiphilum]GGF54096.1 siderophore-interacting protein [Azorhizobium oxalatiphilum]